MRYRHMHYIPKNPEIKKQSTHPFLMPSRVFSGVEMRVYHLRHVRSTQFWIQKSEVQVLGGIYSQSQNSNLDGFQDVSLNVLQQIGEYEPHFDS